MHRIVCWIVAATILGWALPAAAVPEFQKQLLAKYADNVDFAEAARDAKCFLCHQGKKSKKNRNAYGEALAEHLSKRDKKDNEKILAALETVAGQSSNPDDPEAPTFGERIAEGKLPAGELEDLMAEPDAE